MKTRSFILDQAVRTAESCGFSTILVDNLERRALSRDYIADGQFIAAPVDVCSANSMMEIARRVDDFCVSSGIQIAAVYTGFNAYAELAAFLADRFGARGNSGTAVRVAHTKTLMRDALMETPGLTTPYRKIESAESARRALSELGPPVVVKPSRGAGSRGVRTGICSEAQLEEAWTSVRLEIEHQRMTRNAGSNADTVPAIMIEPQLVGSEVDVEIVLQNGRRVFGVVADNPEISLPLNVETSTTYPSCLPRPIQEGLLDAACTALSKVDLTDGNFHVEMIQTAEGPRIVEINARIGGAFVWEAINCVYGVDLVQLGVKAVLGVPIEPLVVKPRCVLEACFFIPSVSGVLLSVEGFQELRGNTGFRFARLWKNPGEMVFSAVDNPSDYLGFAAFSAASLIEARTRVVQAMHTVKFWIQTGQGETMEFRGSYKHEPVVLVTRET